MNVFTVSFQESKNHSWLCSLNGVSFFLAPFLLIGEKSWETFFSPPYPSFLRSQYHWVVSYFELEIDEMEFSFLLPLSHELSM